MSELNRDARAFLAGVQGAHDPSPGAKERVRAGLLASLAVPAAAAAEPSRAPVQGRGWLAAKVVAVAAIVGAGAALLLARDPSITARTARGGGLVAASPSLHVEGLESRRTRMDRAAPGPLVAGPSAAFGSSAGAVAPPSPSAAPADVPLVSIASLASSPQPSSKGSLAHGAGARHAPASTAGGSVAAEVSILRRVSAALRAGEPAAALVAVGEHARRFPNGALAEERDTERIVALCALGRRDEGARATERFNRAYPSSAHAARIQAACAPSAPPVEGSP